MRCHGCGQEVYLEDVHIRPLYSILMSVRTYKKDAKLSSLTKEDLLSGEEVCAECGMFLYYMGQAWTPYKEALKSLRAVQGFGVSNGNHKLPDRDKSRLVR
ncbi:MAG: hypothetical protein ACYCZW_00330 [Minisyncoccota bacterium]